MIWTTWSVSLLAAIVCVEIISRGILMRTFWREVVRLFVILDLQATKNLQKVIKPRYVLRGGCQKRGLCCTQIMGNPPRIVKRTPFLLKAFSAYHRLMHNFQVVGRGPDESLIFSCGHLKNDGRCGIYRYRPLICRNYPVLPFYDAPSLMPGCGYRVVLRELKDTPERPSLRIINPKVAVHHPTPLRDNRDPDEMPDEFHWVDVS